MQQNQICIRQIEHRDLESTIQIHIDPKTNAFNPHPPTRRSMESTFNDWLRMQLEGIQTYSVIEVDGKVAGFGGVIQKDDGLIDSSYYNLYFRVSSNFQRCGLGYRLGKYGLLCAERDAQPVVALVRDNNEPSIKLINKIGLEDFKTIPKSNEANQLLFVKRWCGRKTIK